MLDDYKDKQYFAYNLFCNELKNNTVSHAYLIDENNSGDSYNLIKAFVKAILCDNRNNDCCGCDGCQRCKLVEEDAYPELKVIRPDGALIKKGQLLELQQEFSRAPIYGKKRIYIIFDCEKMRAEAANSILKFLEEPNEDIIAFLVTNNINNVLTTIISRCQIIKLNNDNKTNSNEYVDFSINFIKELELFGILCITREKELWFDKIDSKNRDGMILALDNMITMYYDMLKLFVNEESIVVFSKYKDVYIEVMNRNNESSLIDKIKFLVDVKDSIKFNVNSNLVVDNIILSIGGYDGSSRN